MHRQVLAAAVVCVACLWGSVEPAAGVVEYSVTDLWVSGGPMAISQSGQVVGGTGDRPNTRAALWSGGVLTELSALAGMSLAASVNDVGQIAGVAYADAQNTHQRAVVWTNGVLQDLNASGLPNLIYASGINNAGKVAVSSLSRAYLWEGGQVTDLQMACAWRINNPGQVVGAINTADVDWTGRIAQRAALWTNGTVRDLGALGGVVSQAWDMNDMGAVVGQAETNHQYSPGGYPAIRAALWDAMGIHDLGAGDMSYAFGINNSGQIVGAMQGADPSSHANAFLYSRGQLDDLNDLIDPNAGVVLFGARGINDSGQIIAEGSLHGQPYHTFLLTPTPLPTTFVLLLPGILWVQRGRHRTN